MKWRSSFHILGDDFRLKVKEKNVGVTLPYTTSSMQQDAANKINFRIVKTMMSGSWSAL